VVRIFPDSSDNRQLSGQVDGSHLSNLLVPLPRVSLVDALYAYICLCTESLLGAASTHIPVDPKEPVTQLLSNEAAIGHSLGQVRLVQRNAKICAGVFSSPYVD
jgi:hypothetical protein